HADAEPPRGVEGTRARHGAASDDGGTVAGQHGRDGQDGPAFAAARLRRGRQVMGDAMKKTRNLAAAIVCAFVAAIAGGALRAQETRSDTLLTTEHWLDWERVSDAQISPDGSRIVYTRQHVNRLEDKWESSLWILNADGSQHRFLVKGSAPRWSLDGKRLMYLAEGEPKGSQIFVRWVDAEGPATQVTRVADAPRRA